jgi:hypothetical protein
MTTIVPTTPSVLIRLARDEDAVALTRLAILDSALRPAGEVLIAEADGELVAARSVTTGTTVSDPFRPTADVLALLALRAKALAVPRIPVRERIGLRMRGRRMASHPA